MKKIININDEQLQDLIAIQTGLYNPLSELNNKEDYLSICYTMHTTSNQIWPLPVALDIQEKEYLNVINSSSVGLQYHNDIIADLDLTDCFKIDLFETTKAVFGTNQEEHPGVLKEFQKGPFRIGGKLNWKKDEVLHDVLSPNKTKEVFKKRGWKTIAGFQTRNPIHQAHEFIQRTAMEICDGLFINPSIGWKKKGDFTEKAIVAAYDTMLNEFYPPQKVYFEGLRVFFRYAGPKEAIFHAILRRNLGCTHFIIGRDHAGVGDFYKHYDAHDLANKININNELGIQLLLFREPYYCMKCQQITTDKQCAHAHTEYKVPISGTKIRQILKGNSEPDERFMRKEIVQSLLNLKNDLFEV